MKTTKKYGKSASLALDLWVKLARASATFDKMAGEQIRGFGLTKPQFGVLEALGHLGTLTFGELSKKQLVSGGNMTMVVDNLEKEELVERMRSLEDRRAVRVQLTQKGKTMFDEIFIQHAKYITTLTSVLTEEEQRTLAGLLKKLGLELQSKRVKN